jgi:hypothetical protein
MPVETKGAYTDSFDISPESTKSTTLTTPLILLRNPKDALRQKQWGPAKSHGLGRRRIQPNIIKVHRTRTTGYRIILITKTKGNRIDIG